MFSFFFHPEIRGSGVIFLTLFHFLVNFLTHNEIRSNGFSIFHIIHPRPRQNVSVGRLTNPLLSIIYLKEKYPGSFSYFKSSKRLYVILASFQKWVAREGLLILGKKVCWSNCFEPNEPISGGKKN